MQRRILPLRARSVDLQLHVSLLILSRMSTPSVKLYRFDMRNKERYGKLARSYCAIDKNTHFLVCFYPLLVALVVNLVRF